MVHTKPSLGLICALAWVTGCTASMGTKRGPLAPTALAHTGDLKTRLGPNLLQVPLSFEPNQGQTDGEAKFLSHGRGYSLFLTGEEADLVLRPERSKQNGGSITSDIPSASVLRLKPLGSKPAAPEVSGLDELPGRSNYFIGGDPRKWRTDVPHFARVLYRNVFPGVNLVYHGNQRQLEFDFEVSPGGDPTSIRMGLTGGDKLEIDADGELVLTLKDAEVRLHQPVVYQPAAGNGTVKHFLQGRYVLIGDREIRFQVPGYDRSKPLVIDPVLSYATWLGGSNFDSGNGIAVDSAGSAYVTGETASMDFPTMGAYQGQKNGISNVFVTKFDPTGTSLVYSTYLGGTNSDRGNGIAVDAAGNAYVAGRTDSIDFPVVNWWQGELLGDYDAFVT